MVALLFVCSLSYAHEGRHPYHAGALEIEYNLQTKRLEITGTFFLDDFENALTDFTGKTVKIPQGILNDRLNADIKTYAARMLAIVIKGKKIPLHLAGAEGDRESVHIYLESEPIAQLSQLDIYISFLYNIFDDQLIIVHAIKGERRVSQKIVYPQKLVKVQF